MLFPFSIRFPGVFFPFFQVPHLSARSTSLEMKLNKARSSAEAPAPMRPEVFLWLIKRKSNTGFLGDFFGLIWIFMDFFWGDLFG